MLQRFTNLHTNRLNCRSPMRRRWLINLIDQLTIYWFCDCEIILSQPFLIKLLTINQDLDFHRLMKIELNCRSFLVQVYSLKKLLSWQQKENKMDDTSSTKTLLESMVGKEQTNKASMLTPTFSDEEEEEEEAEYDSDDDFELDKEIGLMDRSVRLLLPSLRLVMFTFLRFMQWQWIRREAYP